MALKKLKWLKYLFVNRLEAETEQSYFNEKRKKHLAHEHSEGLVGHSDADVLCHAVADALLGAMGMGDLGQHFPPGDPRWKDMSSLEFLRRIRGMIEKAGAVVSQVDGIVYMEAPRVGPHLDEMRSRMGEALGVPPDRVSVKATTTEGLGFVGRSEGLAALAVVLMTGDSDG